MNPSDTGSFPDFHEQAERCRRLAGTIGDSRTVETLKRLAAEYESRASGSGLPSGESAEA